ncbi:MAG: D-2-hydroxyacid dehydrogenase, partial [Chloroflexota bacterium]
MAINVLIVSKNYMPTSFMEDIKAVDPSVRVKNAVGAYVREMRREEDPARYDRLLREVHNDTEQGVPSTEPWETLDSLLAEAEVAFAQLLLPKDLAARAPRLRWLHYGGVGINQLLGHDVFDGRVTVTNAAGALASPISEHVMTFIFMQSKSMPRILHQQAETHWYRFENTEVAGKTVGLIGMGAIANQVAARAKCMGMRVVATRRTATAKEHGVGLFDEVFPLSMLPEMLGESDFVVLALPLTNDSHNLIGERELRAMKPTAYIINVSRGPIIDQPVLIRALKEGWIAGAGLDVVEEEPLPNDNALWSMSNVILSPHMAGHTEKRAEWVSRQFCDNLKRYIS